MFRGEETLGIAVKGEVAVFKSYQLTIVGVVFAGVNKLALSQAPGFKQTDVIL